MYPYFPYAPRSAFYSPSPNWPIGGSPYGPPIPLFPPRHLPPPPVPPPPIWKVPFMKRVFPTPHDAYWDGVARGLFNPSKLTIISVPPPCPSIEKVTSASSIDIIDSTEGYIRKPGRCYYDRSRKILVYCQTENAEDEIVLCYPVKDRVDTRNPENDRNFITQEGLLHFIAHLEITKCWHTCYSPGVRDTRVETEIIVKDEYDYDFPNGLFPIPVDIQGTINDFKDRYGAFYLTEYLECPMWIRILTEAQTSLDNGLPFYIPFDRHTVVSVLSIESVADQQFTVRYGNEILVFNHGTYEAHPYTTKISLFWSEPLDTDYYHWYQTVAVSRNDRFAEDIFDGSELYNSILSNDSRDACLENPVVLSNIDQTKRYYIRVFTVNDVGLTDVKDPWDLVIDQGLIVSDNRREA